MLNPLTNLSIIAVHGLNTESPATWRAFRNHRDNKDGYIDWLADADMLPSVVPSSPIWTFHYNSSWQSDAPMERLSNLADRLLRSLDNILFQRSAVRSRLSSFNTYKCQVLNPR